MTSARDIVESGQPPRAVFLNYPLGHTTGRPFDRANQTAVVNDALLCFESSTLPGQIVDLPYSWSETDWQSQAMRSDDGDTRSARDESPQWQHDADRIAAGQ